MPNNKVIKFLHKFKTKLNYLGNLDPSISFWPYLRHV